jgi:hypothetical protein
MWVRESGVTVVTAFQCLQLTVEGFVNSIPAGARVVFDARTPHERVMTDEDLAFLRTLLSEKNRIGRPG